MAEFIRYPISTDNTGMRILVKHFMIDDGLGNSVPAHTYRMIVQDADNCEKFASVTNSTLTGSEYGLTVRTIPSGVQSVSFGGSMTFSGGSVTVTNFPSTYPVTGTFWQTTQPVSGTFWQTTQPVSLASVPSHAVTNAGTFAVQSAQSGSWSVGVNNFPATQAVSGTFWQTTQPVSLSSIPSLSTGSNTIGNIGTLATITNVVHIDDNSGSITVDNGGAFAVQAAQSGAWNVTNVSGTVSLPTGASTAANQTTLIANTGALSYKNITSNTTTLIKSGSGMLGYVNINLLSAVANTATIYDSLTGSGTKIATLTLNISGPQIYSCAFTTGLTVVTGGLVAPDLTVTYR